MYKVGQQIIVTLRNDLLGENWHYDAEVIATFAAGTAMETERKVYLNNDQIGVLTHENCPVRIRKPFVAEENWYYVRVGDRVDTVHSEEELALATALSEVLNDIDTSALTCGTAVETRGDNIELVPESDTKGNINASKDVLVENCGRWYEGREQCISK